MNIKTIKQLAMTLVLALTSTFAFAGTGVDATHPFTVCASTGFKLNATVSSGTADHYAWFEDGSVASGTTGTLAVASTAPTSITQHIYKVVAYSVAGCPSDTQTIYVKIIPALAFTSNTPDAICAANSNTAVASSTTTLTATRGASPTDADLTALGISVSWGTWGAVSPTIIAPTTSSNGVSTVVTPVAGTYNYSFSSSYSGIDVAPSGGCVSNTLNAQITVSPIPVLGTTGIAAN